MKRLTKEQLKQHAQLAADLHDAREELDGAVATFNAAVAAAYVVLEPFVSDFNAKVAEANTFAGLVHAEQQDHFDEKSEKWQEGDAGQTYQSWMDEWDLAVEEVELDEAQELSVPEVDLDSFAQLETECPS